MQTMKAAVCTTYGSPDVLRIVQVPKPQPKANEVLVKIVAVAVTAADARVRAAKFPKGFGLMARLAFGIRGPRVKVLGSCFSGVVEAVGQHVGQFKIGDEVCGMNGAGFGAYAEYITIPADKALVVKPKTIHHAEAASVLFGGTTALYFLRDLAKLTQGQQILITGASGAVGSHALQLANHFGAQVTAITSTPAFAKKLGAAQVLTSFDQVEQAYDCVMDTTGMLTVAQGKQWLKPHGKLLLVAGGLAELLQTNKQVLGGNTPERQEDVSYLLQLLEGKVITPALDPTPFTLDAIVDAHQHYESGKKQATIVVHI